MAAAMLAFPVNMVVTVGLNGAIGVFRPSRLATDQLVPAAAES